MRRLHADKSAGQALAEFAIVAPIFFLLLMAIIEGGRFIFFYETLNNATRDGARYAIIHGANATCADGGPTGPMPPSVPAPACHDPSGDDVREAVSRSAFGIVGAGDLSMPDPTYDPPNNGRGSDVTVRVNFTYSTLLPMLPPITITAETTLVVNN
jgi:hypothetical protein